ncbi:TPA: hypothetical protein ACTHA9_001758, partial [Streptococcus pyogenes]
SLIITIDNNGLLKPIKNDIQKTRYFKNSGLISLFKLLKQGLYYLRVTICKSYFLPVLVG